MAFGMPRNVPPFSLDCTYARCNSQRHEDNSETTLAALGRCSGLRSNRRIIIFSSRLGTPTDLACFPVRSGRDPVNKKCSVTPSAKRSSGRLLARILPDPVSGGANPLLAHGRVEG